MYVISGVKTSLSTKKYEIADSSTTMSPPSSSSTSSSKCLPPPPGHQSPRFTPIQECEREGDGCSEDWSKTRTTPGSSDMGVTPKHRSTPLHEKKGKPSTKKRHESCDDNSCVGAQDDGSVSCNKCRPHSHRDKISVVPLDNGGVSKTSFIGSPNGIFRSIFHSLARKSPKSTDAPAHREEQWKIAVAELSHKLIQATRKRDEALLEASRLKYSMAELEKKLNKLEVYCHNLKFGLDECSSNSPYRSYGMKVQDGGRFNEKVIEEFLVFVSEARSSIRMLSKSLTMQLRHLGGKVFERISMLLQPYDVKVSFAKHPKSLVFYLEALLNKAFFEDFESIGFQKNSTNPILNPAEGCEANYASFVELQGLTWEEVLNKGTRHFSEEFSRFCDRKMSEIVNMLGWNRAWPEPLLQAFFSASKSVWLVHVLANSLHPGLPIFRVDKGVRFDSVYMEDMGGERAKKLVPIVVRIMVAPGFYVYGNLVKCKVLCSYYTNSSMESNIDDQGPGLIN